jgi:hypothetical protein
LQEGACKKALACKKLQNPFDSKNHNKKQHGGHKANREKEHRGEGPKEAARNKGMTQVRKNNIISSKAAPLQAWHHGAP